MGTRSRHVFMATQLGMSGFPPQLLQIGETRGAHVSGFSLKGWLTRLPIDRWGEEWIERGQLAIRNRGRVWAGQDISVVLSHEDRSFDFTAHGPSRLVAEGWAAMPDPAESAPDVSSVVALAPRTEPIGPIAQGIAGQSLGSLAVQFQADRDLQMVQHLATDDPWRGLTIAHPSYLVWVANVLIKDAFGFGLGEWIHAGTVLQNFAPIQDGAAVRFIGTVAADPIRPGNQDLTRLSILVLADESLASSLEVTIATAGSTPLRYQE
jgi:hypothetical protein